MSKAFTKETDIDEQIARPIRAPLPLGVKNYITPGGAQRLRDELEFMLEAKSLAIKRAADAQGIDARIRQLTEIIASLVISESRVEGDVVRFGASVKLQRATGVEQFRLVGVDEVDLDRNHISWLSPLAKALLGKRMGERVQFRSPVGIEDIAILEVSYP